MKNRIISVDPESPAADAGIHPQEMLVSINGKMPQDVLDYKFYSYDSKLTVVLEDGRGKRRKVRIRKETGEDLGLNFETYLMDRAKSCANRCIFCFIDQLPAGMRKTLYFKDDDARLSFLQGNYITMTNLSGQDIERICKMRISPINISVHTTNPELRERMLRNKNAGECLEIMKKLAAAGIEMNCQIVLCPGINDNEELEKTLKDLFSLYPKVLSVSVVPVGLTKYREHLYPLRLFSKEEAESVVTNTEQFAEECKQMAGSHFVWCSDEFYLMAQRKIPQDDYYEAYFQYENGVGMLRLLDTEAETAFEKFRNRGEPHDFSLACGVAAAPFIEELCAKLLSEFQNVKYRIFPIRNTFFGETVTVSGLITGQDLIRQLKGKELNGRLLISCNMLRAGENVFLDDISTIEVEKELNVRVIAVPQSGEDLIRIIFSETPGSGKINKYEETKMLNASEEYYRYNR